MATVTTTTFADALCPPGNAPMARRYISATTDYLYCVVHTATDTLTVYVSTNSGTSWASLSSFTHTGLQEWSSVVYETTYLHIAYRIGTGSTDAVYYRRYNITANTWSAAQISSGLDANGGTIGSRWQGVDLLVKRNSNGSYAIMVVGAYSDTSPAYGAIAMGVSITTGGTIYLNNGIITGKRIWTVSGTSPGRSGVSVEPEHNGDGYTTSTPNAWICWGRADLRMVKVGWVSSSVGWSGPSSSVLVRSSLASSQDYTAGRWDGTQWLMAVPSPDDVTTVRVYQRNRANTSQSTFDTPTHPNGNVRYVALSYDNTTKNIRVFAVATSANTLYYVDYNRGAGTWSSWAQVSASVLAGSGTEFAVRRGGSSGNARHDVVYSVTGSPNTVTHSPMSTSSAPATAVWVTVGQAYTNGSAANVSATLPLTWSFTDLDPGGAQGSYALSRQIGAGAVSYWNATSSAWGGTEVQNTSSTSGVTLGTAWGIDGDSPHQYKVKVWDNTGTVAPGYSNPLTLYPSAPVNPTVGTPSAGATLNSDTLTVTWTVTEQTGARVTVTQTSPSAGIVYDSGAMMGYTTASFTIPYALQNGYGYTITLYTYNNDQLVSAAQARAVTVTYAPPPVMYSTFTPLPASGYITVTGSANSPVGAQPSIITADLYRRANTTPVLNTNSAVAGSTTGFFLSGASGGTLSYSTAQASPVSSAGSARLVPNGTGAAPAIESTAVAISPTGLFHASAWFRPDTANKPVTIYLNWYTSGGTFISATSVTMAAPVATAWQYLEVVGDASAVASVGKAGVAIGLTGTPATGDGLYADEIKLRVYNSSTPIRVVTGVTPTATFNDWGTASGVDYEYQWTARGSTGTTVVGPWLN
jgi:hypothetical protein